MFIIAHFMLKHYTLSFIQQYFYKPLLNQVWHYYLTQYLNLDYLTYNIPISNKHLYKQKLYQKVFKFIQNWRWRTFRFNKSEDNTGVNLDIVYNHSKYLLTKRPASKFDEVERFVRALYLFIKYIELRV